MTPRILAGSNNKALVAALGTVCAEIPARLEVFDDEDAFLQSLRSCANTEVAIVPVVWRRTLTSPWVTNPGKTAAHPVTVVCQEPGTGIHVPSGLSLTEAFTLEEVDCTIRKALALSRLAAQRRELDSLLAPDYRSQRRDELFTRLQSLRCQYATLQTTEGDAVARYLRLGNGLTDGMGHLQAEARALNCHHDIRKACYAFLAKAIAAIPAAPQMVFHVTWDDLLDERLYARDCELLKYAEHITLVLAEDQRCPPRGHALELLARGRRVGYSFWGDHGASASSNRSSLKTWFFLADEVFGEPQSELFSPAFSIHLRTSVRLGRLETFVVGGVLSEAQRMELMHLPMLHAMQVTDFKEVEQATNWQPGSAVLKQHRQPS